jgi:hypothetical protein
VISYQAFIAQCWARFSAVNTDAARLFAALEAINGGVSLDHVAFRTLNLPGISLADYTRLFSAMGFYPYDAYEYPGRHLVAKAFRHADDAAPKLFMSEFDVQAVSVHARRAVEQFVPARDIDAFALESVFADCADARLPDEDTYERLREESEYLAWYLCFGTMPNHFAVFVNELPAIPSLDELIDLTERMGIPIDQTGGLIKGSAMAGLQQASTRATPVMIQGTDGGRYAAPGGFLEFVLRYPMSDGRLYQGFNTRIGALPEPRAEWRRSA